MVQGAKRQRILEKIAINMASPSGVIRLNLYRTIACGKFIRLHAHAIKQAHKQIAKRRVVVLVASYVPSMIVSAASKNNG